MPTMADLMALRQSQGLDQDGGRRSRPTRAMLNELRRSKGLDLETRQPMPAVASPAVSATDFRPENVGGWRDDKGIAPAFRPIERLGPAIIEEAKEGRETLQSAFVPASELAPLSKGIPGVEQVENAAVRAGRFVGGGLQTVFPFPSAIGKALGEEPVTAITGSETAGMIAGLAVPLGVLGATKIPAVAARIARSKPLTQLGVVEAGGDVPLIPGVANIGSRKKTGKSDFRDLPSPELDRAVRSFDATPTAEQKAAGKKRGFGADQVSSATKERLTLADLAENKYGYKIGTGEITANKRVAAAEDAVEHLGGPEFAARREHNKKTFNEFVSGRHGNKAQELSQEWFVTTSDKLSEEFSAMADDVGAIAITPKTLEALEAVRKTAGITGGQGRVNRTIASIRKYGETMSSEQYREVRSEISQVARSSTDRDLARRLRQINEALDDAVSDSLGSDKAAAWADTRRRYAEFQVLDKATDLSGNVNPSIVFREMRKALRGGYRKIAHGENEFLDHVRILETFKKSIPSSGTAERTKAIQDVQGATRILARLTTGSLGLAMGDVTGAVGGLLAPAAAEKILLSKAFRERMLKKSIRRPAPTAP